MTAMTTSQAHVGCLVLNAALGRDGKVYQDRIERYLKDNGPEWTCNRVKSVRQVALCLRSGEREKALEVLRENSIAYHKDSLLPKGIEGVIVRRFVEAQRPAVIKRVSAAMRFYTSFKLEAPSEKQKAKVLKAITGPSSLSPEDEDRVFLQGRNAMLKSMEQRRVTVKPLDADPIRTSEKHAEHLKATSAYYSRYKVPKELRSEPYAKMAMSFMTEPWLPPSLDSVTPCQEMRELIRSQWIPKHPQLYAGKVWIQQEQGCKPRCVCTPSAWLQLAFMPLRNRMVQITDKLYAKESNVRDQTAGANTMQAHIQAGGTVYCTDLSSATDRFPRWYIEGMLYAIGYQPYADAIDDLCRQKFYCDFAPNQEVQYTVGTQMGVYANFECFNLCNCLVADEAARLARRVPEGRITFPDGTMFHCVGDDIITPNRVMNDSYTSLMRNLGVEISEPKSFQGNVAEFAGYLAVRTNKSVTVFRPYKVPDGNVVTNPVQFLDALGCAVKAMPRRSRTYWTRQWELYQRTVSSRDLALEPLLRDDHEFFRNANRGDNRDMVNLTQGIAFLSKDSLPDLSGSTKINREPLFRERGPMDYYGYNPDLLKRDEAEYLTHPMRRAAKALRDDPLMRAAVAEEKGDTPSWKLLTRAPNLVQSETGVSDDQPHKVGVSTPIEEADPPRDIQVRKGTEAGDAAIAQVMATFHRVTEPPELRDKDFGTTK